jgi:hypothetical protein
MKKSILIVVSILLVAGVLGFRLVFSKFSGAQEERVWYALQLGYDFSVCVDTVIMLRGNVGLGKVVSNITRGKPDQSIEDSLNQHLKRHKFLRLLMSRDQSQVAFIVPGAERYLPGDSIAVNSATNKMAFFREGVEVSVEDLSAMLEARGDLFTF